MSLYKNVEFQNSAQLPLANVGLGNYTITANDNYVYKSAITAGGNTLNLPAIGALLGGQFLIIKDASGTAGTNNITIDANGADTIDGAGTYVISTNYGSVSLMSDGISNWQIF